MAKAKTATPDFNALSEAEQRAVAERLLRIEQSGWKPFWCPDPACDGAPHTDEHGDVDPRWAHRHARADQRLPAWNKPWRLLILSGRGCIAPWTLLDLADGSRRRVDELATEGRPVLLMTPDGPRWTLGAPYLKGHAHQWRVRLSTGRVLTVTDKHRLLAPGGWLPLDHVRVGQPLVAAALDQTSTGVGLPDGGLEGWREGAQRCWGRELGCGCGCRSCRRPSDLPPPPSSTTDQDDAPSPDGGLSCTRPEYGSGDQETSPAGSRPCPRSTLRTRSRFVPGEPSRQAEGYPPQPSHVGRSLRWLERVQRSLVSTALGLAGFVRGRDRGVGACVPSSVDLDLAHLEHVGVSARSSVTHRLMRPEEPSAPRPDNERSDLVTVESIEYSHFGPFYDLTVPGADSYYSEGVVSHNSGKTTTGTEFVTLSARKGINGAIIGRRGTELVNTHVATLIERAHPEFMPVHWASKDLVEWPNGAITYLFSGERPENIRSVNMGYFWMDEFAWMPEVETAWMNAQLATRIETPGNPIHILLTSTPTATPFVMAREEDEQFEVRRVSTYANAANLSADFLDALRKEYEGTRMGRQELHGEVLRDVEGALWNDDLFVHERVDAAGFEGLLDAMDDRVVAIDPAGSKGPRSDATGIIGMGAIHEDAGVTRGYVLADGTLKGSPTEWAAQAFRVARHIRANRIVVENNFGGDMVAQTLSDFAASNPDLACDADGEDFRVVVRRAVKSKETRAEPLVGRYEQGLITHVTSPGPFGDLSTLEIEQTTWVPRSRGGKMPSPNRVDAEVWCWSELHRKVRFSSAMASGRDVLARVRRSA